MTKGADAFRSIGEVAALLGVAPHVLRYWETQFALLKPMKRPDGRRYYRPDDVRLAAGLCSLLRDDGLTIRGARKLMTRDRGATVRVRGAARLAGIEDAGAFDPEGPLADPLGFDPSLGRSRPGPEVATDPCPGDAAPEDVPEDEPDDPAPGAPRSRQRRRPAARGKPPLSQAWLADVVALNARLRALCPADAKAPDRRATLARLRDALARMC